MQNYLQKVLAFLRDCNYRFSHATLMAANAHLKLAIFTSELTQTVVARNTDIDESRLSRIINGHTEATPDERKALARELKKPIRELFPEAVAS